MLEGGLSNLVLRERLPDVELLLQLLREGLPSVEEGLAKLPKPGQDFKMLRNELLVAAS